MRDLFRLIAVGAMSFAVVGAAMLYSRGGDVSSVVNTVSDTMSGAVEGISSTLTGIGVANASPASETYTINVARPKAAAWVGLAGLPDQTEIAFPIPSAGSYRAGTLNLTFDTQLSADGDGLLTLSVNGTTRGQLVLDSGRHTHQARIELTPADLSGDQLMLHMAARGTTNSGQTCPADATNSGSAVTLSPASVLELVSDTPPANAVGALLAAPGPLALQPGTHDTDLALAIWANQRLTRAGLDTRLSAGGSGETPVTVTSHAVTVSGTAMENVLAGQDSVMALVSAAHSTLPPPLAFPVSVADLGAETTVKSFRGSRRWTVAFAAADMPNGALPEIFSLKLRTTPLAGDSEWMVRVSLNGSMVETHRVAGSSTQLDFQIALPPERHLPQNALVVELVDTTAAVGLCARPPEAQAQLLPESSLLDATQASMGWAALIETLAATSALSLEADGLSLAQATEASNLLALVLPQAANMRFDGQAPIQLRAVTRDGARSAMAAATDMQALLPVSTSAGPSLVVLAAGPALDAALERLDSNDVIVLVNNR